jgi:hypothetical protein
METKSQTSPSTHRLVKLGILFALLFFTQANARISIEFSPERISANEEFTLSLVVPHREIPQGAAFPVIEDWKGLQLIKKDSIDDIQQQFFGGRVKVRYYRFHLKSSKSGTFHPGPLYWPINGEKMLLSKAVNVEVQRSYDSPGLSLQLKPAKRSVYEGEQFALKLYVKAFNNFSGNLELKSIDWGRDFYGTRNDDKLSLEPSREPGVRYAGNSLFAWLSPARSGKLTMPALSANYMKEGKPEVKEIRRGNFYSRSTIQEPQEAVAKSRAIEIQVKPLPAGAPENFSGLTGQYSFSVKLDTLSARVGDALTLTITQSGNGRPGYLPELQWPDLVHFRTVPPETQISREIKKSQYITKRTTKIFLYPRKAGTFKIPSLSFSYFDPRKKEYITLESEEYEVTIDEADPNSIIAENRDFRSSPQSGSQEITQLGEDIRHIHSAPTTPAQQLLYKQFWFFFIWLMIPIVAFILHFILVRREKMALNPQLQKQKLAYKNFTIHLKQLHSLDSSERLKKSALLQQALLQYLNDKFAQEWQGLSLQQQCEQLALHFNEDDVHVFKNFMNKCEEIRYGGGSASAIEESFHSIETLVQNWEKKS